MREPAPEGLAGSGELGTSSLVLESFNRIGSVELAATRCSQAMLGANSSPAAAETTHQRTTTRAPPNLEIRTVHRRRCSCTLRCLGRRSVGYLPLPLRSHPCQRWG